MKSWIILIVLAVGLTTAVTVAIPLMTVDSTSIQPGFPAPDPGIPEGSKGLVEVDGDLAHQFGVMAQDTSGVHSWVFKNTGNGPLELRNLGTDCSCTVAQLGKADASGGKPTLLVVKPGATETIDVTWKTNRVDGPYKKTARIGTSDPKTPEVVLSVGGTIRPAISMVPADPTVNFQTISNDESYPRNIAFYSSDRPDMVITRAVSSAPNLVSIDYRPMTEAEAKSVKAEKGYVLVVTVQKAAKLGSFAEEIVIETDHPMKKLTTLGILGRITGPIIFSPDRLVLRDVTSSNGGGGEVTISVRGRPTAEFTVVSKPESIDVSFEPIPQDPEAKGSRYKMAVKVIPGAPAGKIDGEIVLKTDHPQATQIKLPLDIFVEGAN